jgi:hypothetical protein
MAIDRRFIYGTLMATDRKSAEEYCPGPRLPSLCISAAILSPFAEQTRAAVVGVGEALAQALKPPVLEIKLFEDSPSWKGLRESLDRLPSETRRALTVLAGHGWHVIPNSDLSQMRKAAELIERGEVHEAHEQLIALCNETLTEFEADLSSYVSTGRARLIRQAIDAHRRCEYGLSIPVFLAQADGVCEARFGVGLYSRQRGDGLPRTREKVESLEPLPFLDALLESLRLVRPILLRKGERSGDILNRHAVLHGASDDYDTDRNSCQALALLAYVIWISAR